MEKLKLTFDTSIFGQPRSLVVEVPYGEGLVATSEFCPVEFLSGNVRLMAALHGETLDSFMGHCRRQLTAMEKITEAETLLDCHVGGLMAVVMDHLGRERRLEIGDLLLYVDCFSLLLKADGFGAEDILEIYPRVVRTITGLYPDHIAPA